jgi:Rrf2 family protein
MKFSAQEEYGLRCLLQIARNPDRTMTIPEISALEGLSPTHVAKLLMILRKGGFVASTRGQAGGYGLARAASEIKVDAVLAALGGKLYDDAFCSRHAGTNRICTHAVDCSVRSLWSAVQSAVDSVLGKLTIADLLEARDDRPSIALHETPPKMASLR